MPASKAQQAATADRRARNLQMRLGGATWDQIADRLEYASKAAACKDFDRALAATRNTLAENAAQLREIQLLRLDRLQAAFWPRAMSGDHHAGKVCLDVHRERVKLLGLDAAQRTLDNAVDAWLTHLGGAADTLDPGDAAALAAVA